jgi:TetR/AcrR family transcriptional repressor of nem operon
MSGNPTYQDLASPSDDKFRVADHSGGIACWHEPECHHSCPLGPALGFWKCQVDAAASGWPPVTYESLVDGYLSEAHRDHPAMGCAVSPLAGEIARSDKGTRAVVTRQIRDNIELVATLIRDTNEKDKGTARSQAVLAYCALVGAIGVARAVSVERLSREILKIVAQLLKAPLRKGFSATSQC